jgi:hypothetical protein
MNERIEKLGEQARKYANENYAGSFVKYDPFWFSLYNKKFAELIVRECVKICMKNQFDGSDNYNNGSISSSEFIKQHFGVEE